MPRQIEVFTPVRPAYFWWFLANLLALSFAIASWTFCLHVFGNPEVPNNYEILRKLGRLPTLKHYSANDAPAGSLLDPEGLYRKFFGLTDQQSAQLNTQLLKNYLTQFARPQLLTYIEGDFMVQDVRPLGKSDFITQGIVVRARARIKPDEFSKPAPYPVIIEYLFPTKETGAEGKFHKGDVLTIRKPPNCVLVMHTGKAIDENDHCVCIAVIPITAGSYKTGDHDSIEITPPSEINPGAAFPLFKR